MEIDRAGRYSHPLSILMLDIDNFKLYNDRYGHLAGNRVLVTLGQVILENIRRSDPAFRYGGEEFTVILPETERQHALMVAEMPGAGAQKTVPALGRHKDCFLG